MGLTHIELTVSNPQEPDRRESLRFLIDSGALYSIVEANILDRIGITRKGTKRFILTNGAHIDRATGTADFEYDGQVGGQR